MAHKIRKTLPEQVHITGTPENDPEYDKLAEIAAEAERNHRYLKALVKELWPHVDNVPQPVEDSVIVLVEVSSQKLREARNKRDSYAVYKSPLWNDPDLYLPGYYEWNPDHTVDGQHLKDRIPPKLTDEEFEKTFGVKRENVIKPYGDK